MSSQGRNRWLDVAESDAEEQSGYDSEAAESKGILKGRKRTRHHDASDPLDLGSEVEDEDIKRLHDFREVGRDGTEDESDYIRAQKRPKFELRQVRTPEPDSYKLSGSRSSEGLKTGVIYLSRVPPFMKPQAVRNFLEPYGEIGRIFLTPEDPVSYSARVKSGGNKKHSFTDGWVEFRRKKDAKVVAETLNTRTIGGRKGGWYHDDVWNIKYLKGFKWHHLTEQIANENAERAARLRAEISQTRKENKRFIANVEHGKMLDAIQAKQKRRMDAPLKNEPDAKLHPNLVKERSSQSAKRENTFEQKSVRRKGKDSGQSGEVLGVLRKIF